MAPKPEAQPPIEAPQERPAAVDATVGNGERQVVAETAARRLTVTPVAVAGTAPGAAPKAKPEVLPAGADQITPEVIDATGKKVDKIETELPQGEWTDTYKAVKAEIDANPEMQGPLANGILALLALAAKYMKYADIIPGRFLSRIEKDEKLRGEKLNDEELKKVLEAKRDQAKEDAAKAKAAALREANGDPVGVERASTKYACSALWGIDNGIEDADTLAAKLLNTNKKAPDGTEIAYFRKADFSALKRDGMPFGTILIFTPELKKAEKVVAIATGNGGEYQYFDSAKGGVQICNLKDEGSPLRSSFNLQAAFVPTFNSDANYFAQHQDQLAQEMSDETPAGRIIKAKKVSADVKLAIAKHLTLPRGEDLQIYADNVKMRIEKYGSEILTTLSGFLDGDKIEITTQQRDDLKAIAHNYQTALNDALNIYTRYRAAIKERGERAIDEAVKAKEEVEARINLSTTTEQDAKDLEAALGLETTARTKLKSQIDAIDAFIVRLQADIGKSEGYKQKLERIKT